MKLPSSPHYPGPDGEPDRLMRSRVLLSAIEHRGPENIAAAIVVLDVEDLLMLSGVVLVVAERVEASNRPDRAAVARAHRSLAAHCARRAVDRFCSQSGIYAAARRGLEEGGSRE